LLDRLHREDRVLWHSPAYLTWVSSAVLILLAALSCYRGEPQPALVDEAPAASRGASSS
jgi:hypothetical protein